MDLQVPLQGLDLKLNLEFFSDVGAQTLKETDIIYMQKKQELEGGNMNHGISEGGGEDLF